VGGCVAPGRNGASRVSCSSDRPPAQRDDVEKRKRRRTRKKETNLIIISCHSGERHGLGRSLQPL
jgi:hypothetical protein